MKRYLILAVLAVVAVGTVGIAQMSVYAPQNPYSQATVDVSGMSGANLTDVTITPAGGEVVVSSASVRKIGLDNDGNGIIDDTYDTDRIATVTSINTNSDYSQSGEGPAITIQFQGEHQIKDGDDLIIRIDDLAPQRFVAEQVQVNDQSFTDIQFRDYGANGCLSNGADLIRETQPSGNIANDTSLDTCVVVRDRAVWSIEMESNANWDDFNRNGHVLYAYAKSYVIKNGDIYSQTGWEDVTDTVHSQQGMLNGQDIDPAFYRHRFANTFTEEGNYTYISTLVAAESYCKQRQGRECAEWADYKFHELEEVQKQFVYVAYEEPPSPVAQLQAWFQGILQDLFAYLNNVFNDAPLTPPNSQNSYSNTDAIANVIE